MTWIGRPFAETIVDLGLKPGDMVTTKPGTIAATLVASTTVPPTAL